MSTVPIRYTVTYMPATARQWGILILFVLLCHTAGIIGSFFTIDAIPTWYQTLHKPSFSPPNWVFGPVWLTLYTLMGAAVFLVWKKHGTIRAFWLFWVHLFFNALWSVLFFGLQSPRYALVDIGVLWVLLGITTVLFFRLSRVAGWLLVPYLLWVTFASILNMAIVLLN